MARSCVFVALIVGVLVIVSCSSAAPPIATTLPVTVTAQPSATTSPTQSAQPTTAPILPTATTRPTNTPVPPTATIQPTKASATSTPQASTGGQQKVNLDDYFPKGAGRELVLRDCTTCHSFAPVIMGQRPKARWQSLKEDHRDKASGVTPADYDVIFAYLMENFDDTKPEPKLPEWFLQQQPGIGE